MVRAEVGESVSSTNRGAERSPLDFYETPGWATRAILPHLTLLPSAKRIVDAGCGSGAILREVRTWTNKNLVGYKHSAYPSLVGIEVDPTRAQQARREGFFVQEADFLQTSYPADLIIANPPFSYALEFVSHALTQAREVCMLLRLSWLASQSRAAWHRAHPAHVFVLPRRPSFTRNEKTDSADYAWFMWPEAHLSAGQMGRYKILEVEEHDRRARN